MALNRPKRNARKYWAGTTFLHLQYIQDLEDYIDQLEEPSAPKKSWLQKLVTREEKEA